ncbi:hypothetical protein K402DRAFT_418750 [Aulographum hederae CBS 113979]|uniref:Uncharacterized protein n=1 Tax=Aulographum hederae CBS 113979 TaxID=1176131 RepID=A0A6G1H8V8_9PEZI|nr:hypothetical protein K402DRAFT_418750 [Aulographum hederae CBS 113979]
MPSPFSTDRGELCQHVDYRVGCLSCCAHNARDQIKEAIAEKEKREGAVEGYLQTFLKKNDVAEQDRFGERLEGATKQRAAWIERCQGLEIMLGSYEARIKDVCNCTDPNALSEAFENIAIEHEDELWQVWRNAAKTDVGDGLIKFHQEGPQLRAVI